ncbi:Uncharacterised protein [uncultured archaeon]|nr:Uncharacterised protein [uncultured archaeon]
MNLFLISSAIHTRHGCFSAEQRLEQTIQTLESIKKYAPDSRILLIESSAEQSITKEEAEKLHPLANSLLNLHDNEQIQAAYKIADQNWDVAKNYSEMLAISHAIEFATRQQPQHLKDVERVFKLSGRYYLNETFDLSQHISEKECYVFAKRKQSQFPKNVTGGLSEQLMSRLWSFPASKIALVFFRYNLMLEDFLGSLNQHQYRDSEHLLLKYFSGPYLKEIDTIGVEGKLGPNGLIVRD